MSRAKLLLSFTCNFHYSLRTMVNFVTAIIHIPHCTAQIMDSERAGVFTGRCFNVFTSIHNDCVWLYSTLLRRQRNEIEFVCLHCCRVLAVSGWEQWLVAASCVFQKCDAFFPVVSNLRITTGARPVIRVHHGRMRTLVRAAILRLRRLYACIFRLKSAYAARHLC